MLQGACHSVHNLSILHAVNVEHCRNRITALVVARLESLICSSSMQTKLLVKLKGACYQASGEAFCCEILTHANIGSYNIGTGLCTSCIAKVNNSSSQ